MSRGARAIDGRTNAADEAEAEPAPEAARPARVQFAPPPSAARPANELVERLLHWGDDGSGGTVTVGPKPAPTPTPATSEDHRPLV